MNTASVVSLSAVLLSVGWFLGHRAPVSTDAATALHNRLAALEGRLESRVTARLERTTADAADGNPAAPGHVSAALRRLGERIDLLEHQLRTLSANTNPEPFYHSELEEKAQIIEENLDYSLAILDRAETTGVLDQAMQDEIDETLPQMDRASNKRFWQHWFAAVEAGTIVQLPEIEPADENLPQTEQPLEVTGEH